MGTILDRPVTSRQLMVDGNKHYNVGGCSMQGYRADHEDADILRLELSEKFKEYACFAIMDGHSGDKAAHFCATRVPQLLNELKDLEDPKQLESACLKLDAEVCSSNKMKISGCTLLICLVRELHKDEQKSHARFKQTIEIEESNVYVPSDEVPEVGGGERKNIPKKEVKSQPEVCKVGKRNTPTHRIITASVGDSRALLVHPDGDYEVLTQDHKPDNTEEQRRIISAGGRVHACRVDGQLAMSRAIGDLVYKSDPQLSATEQKVIPVPDVTYTVAGPDDMLLVACDGLFEATTNSDIATFTHAYWQRYKGQRTLTELASGLIDFSLGFGSRDNMSILCVEFADGSDSSHKTSFIPGPMYPKDERFMKAYINNARGFGVKSENDLGALCQLAQPKWSRVAALMDTDDEMDQVEEMETGWEGGESH